ncbi:MAG: hypothetical protein ACYTGV_15075 [Planctomycetota bacterium]|jgi:Tol biopolymer transport system component
MISRRKLLYGAGALVLCALLAFAKGKPGGKPGGGDGGLTGTIYLTVYQLNTVPKPEDPKEPWIGNGGRDLHQMDPDGSNKTSLGLDLNMVGEPSHALHGNQRWFLAARFTYTGLYPTGKGYSAIFAFSADGSFEVQLTDETVLQPTGNVRWSPDDATLSFVGQRWESGAVVESGIYSATIEYDSGGDAVVGLDGSPSLLVSGAGIAKHDWAPGGAEIVYAGGGQIRIANPSTGDDDYLTTGGEPAWSPGDGSLIAFTRGTDGIFTIAPNGSGEQRILRSHAGRGQYYSLPCWSPTGSHLICLVWVDEPTDSDVYRVRADGGGKVNLTSDVDTDARPVGWR